MRVISGIISYIKTSYHRSNNRLMTMRDHLVEIKSQSQSIPPSPNPSTISYSPPALMFLDPDLKYTGDPAGTCCFYHPGSFIYHPEILYGSKVTKGPGGCYIP
jgi:hypothetical protein